MIGIFDSLKKMFRDNGPALIVYCVTSLLLISMLLLPIIKGNTPYQPPKLPFSLASDIMLINAMI